MILYAISIINGGQESLCLASKRCSLFLNGEGTIWHSKFKDGLIAGLTIASFCIPRDIGYAKLANLPPQCGLYSSFVLPLIYAFMGSSRDIAVGLVADIVSVMRLVFKVAYHGVNDYNLTF
ncbi:hypothetical protein V6N13_000850 [Hibiscus sabdariffa]|uniref:SLC26A/SulP transporter domain-containing protein n=1 Tax=Hibiscus sabdariffa TaxID=183260 RepID=A0ABR2G6K4_9ROSI